MTQDIPSWVVSTIIAALSWGVALWVFRATAAMRISALEAWSDDAKKALQSVDALGVRIDGLKTRLDAVDTRLDGKAIAGETTLRFAALDDRIKHCATVDRVAALESRMDRFERHIEDRLSGVKR